MKISASILSIKDNMKENILKLTNTDIDYIHLDIMDGKFVPNKTWNVDNVLEFINHDKPLDIHLMVDNVKEYIDEFKVLKPEYITFHLEASNDIMELINYLKSLNIKVGLSIKPNTKVSEIIKYLPFIDLVLIMSVEPGKGGQPFIESSIDKVNELNNLKSNHNFVIEIDGGINDEVIKRIDGVDIAVVGSFLTNGDYKENLRKLKEQ